MTTPQPRNLFTTSSFLSLASGLLIASTPNIADIINHGGSVEKYLYLVAAILSGAGVTSEKMRKEQELYTPNWFPVGKNKEDVTEVPQVLTLPAPIPAKNEPTIDTVQNILDDAQTVVNATQTPLNLLKLL